MRYNLVRFGYLETCTLGWLYTPTTRFATIEDAWRPDPDGPGGQRKEPGKLESCIPDGLYVLEPHNTPAHPNSWAMVNPAVGVYHWTVPANQPWGRTACLIHAGNTDDAVIGCIAVGMTHSIVGGRHFVTESNVALGKLRAIFGLNPGELQIRPVTGTIEKL